MRRASLVFLAIVFGNTVRAQDAVVIAPKIQKVIFENDIIRVTRATYKPGQSIGVHAHGKGLVIALTSFKAVSTPVGGAPTEIVRPAGSVWWREPMKHTIKNTGKGELRVIEIDLKDTANHEPRSVTRDPVRIDPKHFKLEIDNDYLRVERVHLDPLGTAPLHEHMDRLTVALTTVKRKLKRQGGATETRTDSPGDVQWRPAEVHSAENLAAKPAELLSIEFKTSAPSISPNVPLKRLTIGGAEFCYIDKGSGVPVVLVHGEGEDLRVWDNQIDALAKNFRVIAYSRRYHYPNAWSGSGSDYSYQAHAIDLVKFLQKIHLGKVHLIGHAYGGTVALIVALGHKELVRSVITADGAFPALLYRTAQGRALLREQDVIRDSALAAFAVGDSIRGLRIFVNFAYGEGAYDNLPPRFRNIMIDNARALRAQLASSTPVPRPRCRDLWAPKLPAVLLVTGEGTPPYYARAMDVMAECMESEDRTVVTGGTHGMMYSSPELFNRKILDFLPQHR